VEQLRKERGTIEFLLDKLRADFEDRRRNFPGPARQPGMLIDSKQVLTD
jgi:hypothetical protein